MNIIHRPRAAGKTTEMVRLVKENNGILIVINRQVVETMVKRHQLLRSQVMTWQEARMQLRGVARERPVYVDDAGWILEHIIERKISTISVDL